MEMPRAVKLNYGQFGLKAIQPERIIGKQIEEQGGFNQIHEKDWKSLDKDLS